MLQIQISGFVCSCFANLRVVLLFSCSQFTVNAVDGLKLKNRAARFADTLNESDTPKVRTEPLTLTRRNVSLYTYSVVILILLFCTMHFLFND